MSSSTLRTSIEPPPHLQQLEHVGLPDVVEPLHALGLRADRFQTSVHPPGGLLGLHHLSNIASTCTATCCRACSQATQSRRYSASRCNERVAQVEDWHRGRYVNAIECRPAFVPLVGRADLWNRNTVGTGEREGRFGVLRGGGGRLHFRPRLLGQLHQRLAAGADAVFRHAEGAGRFGGSGHGRQPDLLPQVCQRGDVILPRGLEQLDRRLALDLREDHVGRGRLVGLGLAANDLQEVTVEGIQLLRDTELLAAIEGRLMRRYVCTIAANSAWSTFQRVCVYWAWAICSRKAWRWPNSIGWPQVK